MALTKEEFLQICQLRSEYRTGMLKILRDHLEIRFGPLSPAALWRIRTIWYSDIDRFLEAVFDAKSLAELGLKK
jgi:hypothetical protein